MNMPDKSVHLYAHTTEHLRALLEGREAYEARFGVKVADGVREFLIGPEVSAEFLAWLKSAAEPDPWMDGFGVLHVADNTIIGFCSFTGPPTPEGMVEIAYGIAPGYQRRGYATEAARAIVEYAFASGQVHTIQAHTLPEENVSTRVLLKCGFTLTGEIIHPTDGLVWRWELGIK
jgi:RimJ/RimL family protein N-acetyltransferase